LTMQRQIDAIGFTPTELRVAWQLLGDRMNRVIGAALSITEHTVKKYLHVMYPKAQASSDIGLVLAHLCTETAASVFRHLLLTTRASRPRRASATHVGRPDP
jgi:DNA-binding NarL/FixJ family response regulator